MCVLLFQATGFIAFSLSISAYYILYESIRSDSSHRMIVVIVEKSHVYIMQGGWTPLHTASAKNFLAFAELLTKYADIGGVVEVRCKS